MVQENDFVKAGVPLSDGAITPEDILRIQGPSAVQQYLVNEIQEVYRLQGVKINDKHFEVVIRQMMRKVRVEDPGDTLFLEEQLIHTADFLVENDKLYGMKVVEDAGDSEVLKPGQIVSPRELRDENSLLKRNDLVCNDALVIPCNTGVAVAVITSRVSTIFLSLRFNNEFSSRNSRREII